MSEFKVCHNTQCGMMGTQRRPELWPHVVWCSFLSDGLISEYGITFDTHIVDGFGVSFGREGETMSLGATVIISPNLARYQPEVQWYRDGRWNPRALETLASVWIRLHGQARSDPRSAHLFWDAWFIQPLGYGERHSWRFLGWDLPSCHLCDTLGHWYCMFVSMSKTRW